MDPSSFQTSAVRRQFLLYAAGGVRSLVTGLTGVTFGLYLASLGLGAAQLGLIIGLGLAGSALGTVLVAIGGERFGRRRTLLLVSALSAAGLAVFALGSTTLVLGVAAGVGMLNGMGRDRGAAQIVDQSMLADCISDAARTAAFTRYTFLQDVLGAIGSLAAAVPALLEVSLGLGTTAAYRWTFAGAAGLSLVPLALYAGLPLPPEPAVTTSLFAGPTARLSPTSRRRVAGLSGLFALDSLGGGFLAGSILSYWFFQRFGLGGGALGPLFFAARVLNAASYFGAQALARRIGLVRTMVFTHLPTSLILIALPFIPSAWLVIVLFLVRESLVQMDVPTRQSYVVAVTTPGERTFALAVTGLVRNVGWAVGPGLAGLAMATLGLGAPLLAGAGTKVVYDVALYYSFRRIRPAEEEAA